jgi:heme-degrading monooxygenase HmoA
VIVRISSAIVPHSIFDRYLAHVHASTIPVYEAAPGLISFSVFQRLVVGYVELLTLTMWQSEQALTRFLEDSRATNNDRTDYGLIHMEPHVYELVVSRQGTRQIAEDLQEE